MSIFNNDNRQNRVNKERSINKGVIDKIKRELKKQKFTYESFAKLFGKTEGWFSHIMTGRTKLTVKLLYDIAEKLNIESASLLPNIEEERNPKTFDEYIWHSIKGKLDEYIDKKIDEKLKPKK